MSQVFQLIAFSSSITRYWQQICKTNLLFAEFWQQDKQKGINGIYNNFHKN